MIERALMEIRAQYPQASWVVAISGKNKLMAGSCHAEHELLHVLLCEILDAGNESPGEVWLDGGSETIIASVHPYGNIAVAIGFTPPVTPGAARRLARVLLFELAGNAGHIVASEVSGDDELEQVKARAQAQIEPLLGRWLAIKVIQDKWQDASCIHSNDYEKKRNFISSIKQMGWGDMS